MTSLVQLTSSQRIAVLQLEHLSCLDSRTFLETGRAVYKTEGSVLSSARIPCKCTFLPTALARMHDHLYIRIAFTTDISRYDYFYLDVLV